MSDGLKNVAAPNVTIKLGEKPYRLTPLTPETLGEIEDHVVTLRSNPILKVKEVLAIKDHGFDADQQKFMMEAAIRATSDLGLSASQDDVDNFMNSYDGICFMLWTMVREHQPEVDSPEKAREILSGLTMADLMAIQEDMKRVSGLSALGNSESEAPELKVTPPAE